MTLEAAGAGANLDKLLISFGGLRPTDRPTHRRRRFLESVAFNDSGGSGTLNRGSSSLRTFPLAFNGRFATLGRFSALALCGFLAPPEESLAFDTETLLGLIPSSPLQSRVVSWSYAFPASNRTLVKRVRENLSPSGPIQRQTVGRCPPAVPRSTALAYLASTSASVASVIHFTLISFMRVTSETVSEAGNAKLHSKRPRAFRERNALCCLSLAGICLTQLKPRLTPTLTPSQTVCSESRGFA